MKRTNLMFLVIVASIFFFGCSKNDPLLPELNQSDQVQSSLKSGVEETPFTGICNFVAPGDPGTTKILPNGKILVKGQTAEWNDEADDWRVTGKTIWYVTWLMEEEPNTAKIWGIYCK